MPVLRNIRPINRNGVDMIAADFTIADGRQGCVELPAAECGDHAEIMLQQEAEACEAQSVRHGYRAPGYDRFDELR